MPRRRHIPAAPSPPTASRRARGDRAAGRARSTKRSKSARVCLLGARLKDAEEDAERLHLEACRPGDSRRAPRRGGLRARRVRLPCRQSRAPCRWRYRAGSGSARFEGEKGLARSGSAMNSACSGLTPTKSAPAAAAISARRARSSKSPIPQLRVERRRIELAADAPRAAVSEPVGQVADRASGAFNESSGMGETEASAAAISSSSPAGIPIASSTARLASSEALTKSPDKAK